jgi:hypothetical protein
MKKVLIALAVLVAALVVAAALALTIKQFLDMGFTKGPDAMFGEQHLVTTVALVELHKLRNGRYPESLDDIEHTGNWDSIHLKATFYKPNEDGTAYCVKVMQGWVGAPEELGLAPGFWDGLGYDPTLPPCGE